MDYTMEVACLKDKKQLKLIINPTTNLEREFFNNLFSQGNAIIQTTPNSDEICISIKDNDRAVKLEDVI